MRAPRTKRQVLIDSAVTAGVWSAIAIVLLFFASSGRDDPASETGNTGQRLPRTALFIAGTLGDKSFNDSAARGIAAVQARWNLRARVIEGGYDPTRWEASVTDLADGGDFDLVITGNFAMVPIVERLAQAYPAMHFILYDAAVDYGRCACANVYSILFRQNEGAFLAGWLATRLAGDSRHVGVIGAMQIPVIDDFLNGYTTGAKAADPSVAVTRQYVNSFKDPAAGKEIAKATYGQGAMVIFQAAGASGQGVIEAAAEAQRYVIGVDSDQYAVYSTADPERAKFIVTSVMKDVDVALEQAIAADIHHTLPFGTVASIGLAEGGISLAPTSEVWRSLPASLLGELADVQARIVAGKIMVPSVFRSATP